MRRINEIFEDRWHRLSSKRTLGAAGFAVFLTLSVARGFGADYPVELLLGGLGVCAGLISSSVFERPAPLARPFNEDRV